MVNHSTLKVIAVVAILTTVLHQYYYAFQQSNYIAYPVQDKQGFQDIDFTRLEGSSTSVYECDGDDSKILKPNKNKSAILRDERRVVFPVSSLSIGNNKIGNRTHPNKILCSGHCKFFPTDSGRCLLDQDKNVKNNNGKLKCLPSFLIVGAMKAGTGELMKWLNLHPNLESGKGVNGKNEIHFFGSSSSSADSDSNEGLGLECPWVKYAMHFPSQSQNSLSTQSIVHSFDKSPDYMRNPAALKQIKAMLPSAKLIAILRDPTMRLTSEFNHHCRHSRYVRITKELRMSFYNTHNTLDVDNVSNGGNKGKQIYVTYYTGQILRLDWLLQVLDSISREDVPTELFVGGGDYKTQMKFSDGEEKKKWHGCIAPSSKSKKSINVENYKCQHNSQTKHQLQDYYTAVMCRGEDFTKYVFGDDVESPKIEIVNWGSVPVPEKYEKNEKNTIIYENWGRGASSVPVPEKHEKNEKYMIIDEQVREFFEMEQEEISHGYYEEQIRSIRENFESSQILLLFQEEMFKDTLTVLKRVITFLGVSEFEFVEYAEKEAETGVPIHPLKRIGSKSEWQNLKNSFWNLLSDMGLGFRMGGFSGMYDSDSEENAVGSAKLRQEVGKENLERVRDLYRPRNLALRDAVGGYMKEGMFGDSKEEAALAAILNGYVL